MIIIRPLLVSSLLLLVTSSLCWAQEFGRAGNVQAAGTSYYVFARPGEATVQVLVLGSGGGIYEVGAATRLDEFLALLGGAPSFATRTRGSRIRVNVQLYREEGGHRILVYEARLENMVMEPGQYPTLQDGDLFVVETVQRSRLGWRDVLSIVTSASSLILLYDRLRRLGD